MQHGKGRHALTSKYLFCRPSRYLVEYAGKVKVQLLAAHPAVFEPFLMFLFFDCFHVR